MLPRAAPLGAPDAAAPESYADIELTQLVTLVLLTTMTNSAHPLTSLEAQRHAGMMMPGRAPMCCRMCS
ncbi:hypothetical protein ASC59_14245 [Leifsonia sp. Root1293]|nr:hypothetical protein ASC59_14245 [Leifsonia sp. Root1293]